MTPTRTSRAETVADQLSSLVVSGSVTPGERLGTKNELRERYRVAAGTLNEAIRLLETRGLVHAKPGPQGGIFVTRPPAHLRLSHLILGLGSGAFTVADSLEIREALELPIALQAARSARAADIRRLRKLADAMGKQGADPRVYLLANWDLHEAIADLSVNQLLRTIYVSLLDTAREGVTDVEPDEVFLSTWQRNWALHRDLVEAIASSDRERIRAAVAAHRPSSEELA